jgi:hypothetical protein
MKSKVRIVLLIVILTAGCGPKIINHPEPELKVDFTPFESVGCQPDEYGTLFCNPDSALYTLGCDRLEKAPDLMGGLDPAYPMAVCIYVPMQRPEVANPYDTPVSEYFFNIGGPMPMLVRYVIAVEGEFRLVKNADEFRAVFAPVESADEALSFAISLANVYALYGLKVDWKYRYTISALEDTYVDITEDGYIVHAFDYQFFGCGPHYYYAVDVKVKSDGNVEELTRTKIYRNPALDDLCQD